MRNDSRLHRFSAAPVPAAATYMRVYAGLLALLAISVLAAQRDFGRWSLLVACAIATAKAALIGLYSMHVRFSAPLIRLFAGGVAAWLAVLLGLTMNDYWTRT